MHISVFICSLGSSRPVRCSSVRPKEIRTIRLITLARRSILSIWGIKLGLPLTADPSLRRMAYFGTRSYSLTVLRRAVTPLLPNSILP